MHLNPLLWPWAKLLVLFCIAFLGLMTTKHTRRGFQFGLMGAMFLFMLCGCAAGETGHRDAEGLAVGAMLSSVFCISLAMMTTEPKREAKRIVGILTLALVTAILTGCTADSHHLYATAHSAYAGAAMFGLGFAVFLPFARNMWRELIVLGLCVSTLLFAGCAALPMPFQPTNTQGYDSSGAEGTFIVLAAVDTAQTMHLKPNTSCAYEADPFARALYRSSTPPPGRVLVTNILMITAHTMVTSWLDDKVAAEQTRLEAEDANYVGPWWAVRTIWHVASIGAEAAAVGNNVRHRCRL